jgi:hypothetical protein
MEINTSNQVSGMETAPKVSDIQREKEDPSDRKASLSTESPDYQVNLSNESKKATSELTATQAPRRDSKVADLSEEAAAMLAQQASEQLSQTNASISNQAIQKAVDLFT